MRMFSALRIIAAGLSGSLLLVVAFVGGLGTRIGDDLSGLLSVYLWILYWEALFIIRAGQRTKGMYPGRSRQSYLFKRKERPEDDNAPQRKSRVAKSCARMLSPHEEGVSKS